MKVVYATDINASNIHSWSGLGWYYRKMLEDANCEVTTIDKRNMPPPLYYRLKNRVLKKVQSKLYSPHFSVGVSKHYARCIEEKVAPGSVILSPNTNVLAYLNKDFKKVLFADATFNSLLHLYPKYSEYTAECIKAGEIIDQQAVSNADVLIYTSQWAANSAIKHYGADPLKIAILPFGANLDQLPTTDEVEKSIETRAQNNHINLLFLGVDWVRKGGEYALKVAARLNSLGFVTTLHIVGAVNLPPNLNEPFIVNHGFISKATPEGQQQIGQLLAASHFLLLPTLADCTPVACSEANAFGVPCITSNVGGLPSVIENNCNGHTFSHHHFVEHSVRYIANLMRVKADYKALCYSSYHRYATEMNWKSVGRKIVGLMESL